MNEIKKITSRNNAVVKETVATKLSPAAEGFIIEGSKFIYDTDPNYILKLFTTKPEKHGVLIERLQENNIPAFAVTEEVMDKICDVNSGTDLLCVIKKPDVARPNKLIILDAIQDPGNIGTIIRTAAAFGFGVVTGTGTANPFSVKVARSSAGALLRCFIKKTDIMSYLQELKNEGFTIFSSELDFNAEQLSAQNKKIEKAAIIIGNEGAGVSEEISKLSDKKIFIPMNKGINSLNAAIAAGILMYYFY